MSSTAICDFCTFVNPPEAKICVICKKSLHLPAVPASNVSEIKECPTCSFYNEESDNICQVCGTSLEKKSLLKQERGSMESSSISSTTRICNDCSYQNALGNAACEMCGSDLPISESNDVCSANVCSMCGKGLQVLGNQLKICSTCTHHNLPDAVKCLICKSKFGSGQNEVLNKVCQLCNHDDGPSVACTQCTFINSIGTLQCIICEAPLQHSNDAVENGSSDSEIDDVDENSEDIDVEGFSSDEYVEDDYTDDDSIDVDEDENVEAELEPTPAVDDNIPKYEVSIDSFEMLESAPATHKYFHVKAQTHTAKFLSAVAWNIEILKTSVPPGVWIKAYEDRLDLLSFMIEGPTQTPYENGLFLFDICLPHDFPARPPNAHYISFWHDNLNPNLYVEGKVCVSLLGTWIAKRKEERWGPKSTLLQLIVSIQGLILVEQPYFNEPGYEGQYGTEAGKRLSDTYNKRVILGMIDSTTALIANPPLVFKSEILLHFSKCGQKMYERLKASSVSSIRKPSDTNLEKFRMAIENICKTVSSKLD